MDAKNCAERSMTEEVWQLTPLAGRVMLNKKEAVTGSVFLAILINMFVLVLVQALSSLFLSALPALFWVLTCLLIAADGTMCVMVFRLAFVDASASSAAPPYTIAYRSDGCIVLCHRNGECECFAASDVKEVRAYPAKLGFIVNGWAYSGNLNYGKVTFFLACKEGDEPEKRSVKYVVNCVQAAAYIRKVYLPQCADGDSKKGD